MVVALEEVQTELDALEDPVLITAVQELRAALEVSPQTVGVPFVATNPDRMRIAAIGPDDQLWVVFGLLPRERRVTLLQLSEPPTF